MRFIVAEVLSLCVVVWHWCNGQSNPEDLQKYNITPPNMFGRESPTNKTMDQLIMEAMGGLKGASSLKTINGGILMDLDMLLSKEQYYSLYEQPNRRGKRKAIRNPSLRWTKGEIPYRFYPGHFNQSEQYMIRQAMTEWERYTCLRFREAMSSDTNVILFKDDVGCYSQLGMVGGQQVVSLSSKGCRYTGLYLHEIGHAIGLVHEHQLPNRDDYIEILTANVKPGYLDQFTNYSSRAVDQMNVSYEYSSVMHYGVTAFSKDGVLKTIRVKYPEKEASIGEVYLKRLSFTDVEIVNKMYKCPAKCDPSIQCLGGYVDENCRCVCKDGSQDCQIGGGIKPSDTCGVNTNNDSWKCFVMAQQGECEANSTYMYKECARACGPCGLKRKPETCVKMHPSDKCLKWARNGDCLTNAEWMNNYCCGTCVNINNGTACTNKYQDNKLCDTRAKAGQCNVDTWMIQNCARSCNRCNGIETTITPIPTTKPTTQKSIGECKNRHNDSRSCDAWAKAGYCKTNQYVTIHCARSCGNCTDQGISTVSKIRLANTFVKITTKTPIINKENEQESADDPNGGCRDEKDTCVTWARYGFCNMNRDQAVRLCQKTCKLCDQQQW